MKKVILSITALMMLLSSVAAVSAYEAHIVNVKAHVENALTVEPLELDWGTVFPQEWFKEHVVIALSTSAIAEFDDDDLLWVTYDIWVEDKAITDNVTGNVTGYYEWIGDWLWLAIDPLQVSEPFETPSEWYYVGARPVGTAPVATNTGLSGNLSSPGNLSDQLAVLFLTPVFEDYYNALTDAGYKPDWWPFEDWAPIPKGDPRHIPGGVDLGADIKIQVTGIARP